MNTKIPYISYHMSFNSSYNKNYYFQTKAMQKMKTHFMFTNIFSKIISFMR